MSRSKRGRRGKAVVAGALAAAAALAGGVGVAAASNNPQSSGAEQQGAEQQGAEQRGAEQQGAEQQEPSLHGSVPAREVSGETEQQEAARLAADARISQSQAEAAALQAVPGKVTGSHLGNENGSLIWEVTIQKADRSSTDVKVDAGNGTVLAQDSEGTDEQSASSEGPDGAGEQPDGTQPDGEQADGGESSNG